MTAYVCPVLVGRDAAREQLRAAVEARRAVLVTGPAGVGKSSLIRHTLGTDLVTGRATPNAALRPYRPLVDAVLKARRSSPAPLPPALDSLVAPDAADLDPLHVADALIGWFDGPLVLEDLHWADESTREVAGLLDDAGFPLVATAREAGVPVRQVLDLRPLDDNAIHELAARTLGGALTSPLASAIIRGAEGLPFLVEELLAAFADRLEDTPDGWALRGAEPAVPRSVADTVAPRLAGLDDDERRVLAAAAVIGRRFDWRVVARVTGLDVLPALRAAAALQLLDQDPDRPTELRFRHALTRDAVDALTFPPERAELASKALDVLLERQPLQGDDVLTAAALARAAGRGADAAPLLVEAAKAAFDVHALDAAEQLLDDAAALCPPGSEVHLRALQERLRVLGGMGRLHDVEQLGRHLLRTIPPDDATGHLEVHLRMSRAASEAGDAQRALDHVHSARALLGPQHVGHCHPPRVDLHEAYAQVVRSDADAAIDAARRCIAGTFPDDPARSADEFADVESMGLVVWAQAVRRSDPPTARRLLDRAEAVSAGLPYPLMFARIDAERAALDLDAGEDATAHLDRTERNARAAGGRTLLARVALLRGVQALLRLEDVEPYAVQAERLAARHRLPAVADGVATLRAAAAALDDPDRLLDQEPAGDVLIPLSNPSSRSPWVRHSHARRGSDDGAALSEAAAWFDDHGFAGAAEACRDRLRALGVPLPRRRSALTDVPPTLASRGITAREHEVLQLVAAGLSNREIADKLFLSVRTVDKHVEHLLAKAGCANRTALASLST